MQDGDTVPRNFRAARQMKKIKVNEAAEKLGVSQPALSSWESGRKSPTLENPEKMAELYEVSTDYLLGINESKLSSLAITQEHLRVLNGKPVWSENHGWMLVNDSAEYLISANGKQIAFNCAGELKYTATCYSEGAVPMSPPLTRSEVCSQTEVWVEPISPDSDLREHLRGWYQVKERFVENEYGAKFSLDSYGAKWLAFNMK